MQKRLKKILILCLFGSIIFPALGLAQVKTHAHQHSVKKLSLLCEKGNQLLRGRGGERDEEQGKQLVMEAAKSGEASCQFYLASMYQDGRWVGLDEEKAVYWYQLSAKQGFSGAEFALAKLYLEGKLLEKNEKTAQTWLEKAAKQKHAASMALLGRSLLATEFTKGVAWLQLAAKQGDYDAQQQLASLPELTLKQQKAVTQSILTIQAHFQK